MAEAAQAHDAPEAAPAAAAVAAPAAGPCRMVLEVDDRERHVFSFLPQYFDDGAAVVRRLARGDYAITAVQDGDEQLQALVERKTLKDLAGSLKDGRLDNLEGLVEVRAACGCDLWLFIEGPAFPAPDTQYGRIPYSTLESVILDASVRDGFMVARTKDLADGVRMLKCLTDRYRRKNELAVARAVAGGNGVEQQRGLVLARRVRKLPNDTERVAELWSGLRGVSAVTGLILVGGGSVADWVEWARDGTVNERLAALRYPSGGRVAERSLAAVRLLLNGDAAACAAFYEKAHGVRPPTAAALAAAWPPARLLEPGAPAEAGRIVPPERKTPIGRKVVENLVALFRHRCQPAVQQE